MKKKAELKERIIKAGYRSIEQLIKVAEDEILSPSDEGKELSADRLKNAAATKKLSIFDAFDILERIEEEEIALENEKKGLSQESSNEGFAERHSRK